MKSYHFPYDDDANSRVAAYESMLDLFTLVSFILILAAFIYVAKSAGEENVSSIVAQKAGQGQGVSHTLPQDLLLLVIFQENSVDKIAIVDGSTGESEYLIASNNIDGQLNTFSPAFARVKTIEIAVKEPFAPGVVVNVMRWLADHEYHNYNIYFAEK